MAKGDGKLTLDKWEVGIGLSPYAGFSQMVNVDIFSKPGCLKISNKLERDPESVGVVDELIKWTVQDTDNGHPTYNVDRNGKLYKRDSGGIWTVITGHGNSAANGEGLAIWKGYLFYARRTRLDLMELSTGNWTMNWNGPNGIGIPYNLESSSGYDLHPMLSSTQRSVLYIGNANFMDSLEQVAGQTFDPGNPATYVYNDKDLELGSDYRITCLEEQGTNVAMGTLVGSNGVLNIADVLFWDGFSYFVNGGSTVRLVENGVKMMKNANNVLNIIAGDGVPRVFQTVTSQSIEAKRFNNIDLEFVQRLSLLPGSTDLAEGEVLFGIGSSLTINSGHMGVYSLRNNAYVLRYLISTGRDGSTDSLRIGSVKMITSKVLLVAWRDADEPDEFGVDVLTRFYYTDYSAYVESPLYTVGTEDNPTTYEKVQVIMGKKLRTGDGVKVWGRKSLDDTYVLLATFDTPTYVGRYALDVKVENISQLVDFQVKVELTTSPTSILSPELKEVTFK